MKVGIIGGGVGGLAAAYDLVKRGHEVALFEQAPFLGGQASTFVVGGGRLERFYHHLFKSDVDILRLMEELGLGPSVQWISSKVGVYHGGKVYDFVTPVDLLRFSPLGLADRIRLGLVALYLQRTRDWRKFEGVRAADWISRYAGKQSYELLWGPLLRQKFGEAYSEVSMTWFWGKIYLRFASRGRFLEREKLGYPKGSFQVIIDALEDRIRKGGGQLFTSSSVERIVTQDGRVAGVEVRPMAEGGASGFHPFDAILATVHSRVFLKLVPEIQGDYAEKLRRMRYQTAVCLTVVLKQPLSRIYWLNISDPAMPFVGVVEQTNFIGPENYNGKHIAYLSNYLARDHPLYWLSAEELVRAYSAHLKKINPAFKPSWIEEYYLHRDEAGQPIIVTNYSRQIPEFRTPIHGLWLANTTQIYPEDRGTNYSIRLGIQVARLLSAAGPD